MGLSQPTSSADGAARFELGKIVAVDPVAFTVDVVTEFTEKHYRDIAVSALYCHGDHDGGIYILPEAGAYCYVMTAADGTGCIIGFVDNPALVQDDAGISFRGSRPQMEPGDIAIRSRDGNFVEVLRGGLVRIGATGMAQRMYIPVDNLIRDVFEQYEAVSPLGEVTWLHSELVTAVDPTADATNTAARLTYRLKRTAQDSVIDVLFPVEITVGELSDRTLISDQDKLHKFAHDPEIREHVGLGFTEGTEGAVSITVKLPGVSPVVFTVQVSKDGDMFVMSKSTIHVETKKLFVAVGETAQVTVGDSVILTVNTDGSVELSAASVAITAPAITLNGVVALNTPAVSLSGLTPANPLVPMTFADPELFARFTAAISGLQLIPAALAALPLPLADLAEHFAFADLILLLQSLQARFPMPTPPAP
jgi:hypothetical protein